MTLFSRLLYSGIAGTLLLASVLLMAANFNDAGARPLIYRLSQLLAHSARLQRS